MSFQASLPHPVLLSSIDAQRCNITHLTKSQQADLKISGDSYHDLSQHVMVLFQNKKSGTSEDALHSRDDALFEVSL